MNHLKTCGDKPHRLDPGLTIVGGEGGKVAKLVGAGSFINGA